MAAAGWGRRAAGGLLGLGAAGALLALPDRLAAADGAGRPAGAALAACEGSGAPAAAPACLREGAVELVLVQTVFRHGARTPLTAKHGAHDRAWAECERGHAALAARLEHHGGGPRPLSASDSRQTSKILRGGCCKGQLTTLGHEQAHGLGRWLRERYVEGDGGGGRGFLAGGYSPEAVVSRTTNISRTIQTCHGVLNGLFPDAAVPFLITTETDDKEWLYPNMGACPRLGELAKAMRGRMKEQRRTDPYFIDLERRVKAALGETHVKEHTDFIGVYDAARALEAHGMGLPGALSQAEFAEVEKVATQAMSLFISPSPEQSPAHGEEMAKLSAGLLLRDIVASMERSMEPGPSPRLKLYSGHDTTLIPLLATLGHTGMTQWPPYASNVTFELGAAKAGGQHHVRVWYNGAAVDVDGTGRGWIPFEDFLQAVRRFLPRDWDVECQALSGHAAAAAGGGDSLVSK